MNLTQADYDNVKHGASLLRALRQKIRQNILKLLAEDKRLNVTEIYVKLRLEQSVASQFLAILRKANLVTTVKEGKTVYYSLNIDKLALIAPLIEQFAGDGSHSE